jgi:hypothetical protein
MKRKLIYILVILLCLAVVYGVYSFFGRETYQYAEPTATTTETADTSRAALPEEKAPSVASSETCIKNLEAEIKKNKTAYERGTILVSFQKGTTLSKAATILEKYGLKFDTSGPQNFSTQAWGTVVVTQGQEFAMICKLQTDNAVRYANVNPIIELHE